MGREYFGFSYVRSDETRAKEIPINNPPDIAVIVVYFVVVLLVGIWVSLFRPLGRTLFYKYKMPGE